jgi:hypothetical protein
VTVRQLLQQLCVACSIGRSLQATEYKPAVLVFCLQSFISHITVMEIKLYLLMCTACTPSDVQCVCLYSLSFFPLRIVWAAGSKKSRQSNSIVRVANLVERTSSHMLQIVHSCTNLWQERLNFPLYRQSTKWRNSHIIQLHKLNYVQISCYISFCKNRADLALQVASEQEVNGTEYWHLYLVEGRCIK